MAQSSTPLAPSHGSSDRGTQIAILLEASEAAAANSLDLDALMQELAKLVNKIVDCKIYSLMLPTADGGLRIAHSPGVPAELAESIRVPAGEGLTGRAAGTRSTVLVDDVPAEPEYYEALKSVRSELAVPLVARGRLVAVLDLQSSMPRAFDNRVSDLLELVASRFALAIDVAQMYRAQERQRSTLETLHRIAQEYSSILSLNDLLRKVAILVRKLIRYDVLAIYLKDPHEPVLRHYFGVEFKKLVQWDDVRIGAGLVGTAAATECPVLSADTSKDERYIESVAEVRSEVAVPLKLKGQLIGVLDLESITPERFTHDDVETLTLLGPQVSSAIENARLYEEKARNEARLASDLIAARALQSHMLPRGRQRVSGLEIAARNEPAAVVSGDFYDFHLTNGAVGIINADVSGKGAAAALYAALASGLVRAAAGPHLSPSETLASVNTALHARQIHATFLAACYAQWREDEKSLVLASAGMPHPYVCRRGKLERIEAEGIPLGLFQGSTYENITLDLEPGDFAIVVSDGLSESFNTSGEAYGEHRLLRTLRETLDKPAETILDHLFDDVGRFCRTCTQADDRTAVVMRVTD